VRSPNTVDDRPTHEVRVVSAQDDIAGVLVDIVGAVEIAVDGGGEQAWDVCIVHDIHGAVAIDFVGVDAAVVWIVANAVFANGRLEGHRKTVHLVRQVVLAAQLLHDFCGGCKISREHHVGGDEELVYGSIV